LWYNTLKRENLINPDVPLHKSSNLTHFEIIKNIHCMKNELVSYFAHHEDKNGNLYYKHNTSNSKKMKVSRSVYVRAIEGNVWGRSDALQYTAFRLDENDLESEIFKDIAGNALDVKPMKNKKGEDIGVMYVIKQTRKNVDASIDDKAFFKTDRLNLQVFDIDKDFYHYEKARVVYETLPDLHTYQFPGNEN
jgi:hypothetical protein